MKKIILAAAGLAACILLEFAVTRHGEHHGWHAIPAVYAILGLAGALVLIAVSKILGRLLHRPQNYYRE